MTGVLIQRRNLDTDRDAHSGRMVLILRHTRREPCNSWDRTNDDLRTEGYQGLCSRRQEQHGRLPCRFWRKHDPAKHLDFGLLASRTVRPQGSVVLSRSACEVLEN